MNVNFKLILSRFLINPAHGQSTAFPVQTFVYIKTANVSIC